MFIFKDNELEVALVTYNRCEFVIEWMNLCYSELCTRNIIFSVYDSSSNDETEVALRQWTSANLSQVNYHRIDSSVQIGYKPMIPILNSKADYIWVMGDSRTHDFSELDIKVFPLIKEQIDLITLHIVNNRENDGKIYDDEGSFLKECFVSSTCIGLTIYKRSIFAPLIESPHLQESYDSLFRRNYAFAWLGYFYSVLVLKPWKAAFVVAKIYNVLPDRKKQVWAGRFYESWVQNLCDLMDKIPDTYSTKKTVARETWEILGLDAYPNCFKARLSGGLNKSIYQKIKENGMLIRVTKRVGRVRLFALSPTWLVKTMDRAYRFYRSLKPLKS